VLRSGCSHQPPGHLIYESPSPSIIAHRRAERALT
jgi:hypothetical protein